MEKAGLKNTKFAFLSHEVEGATGFPAAFAEYLRDSGAQLMYIRFPFFMSQTKSIWIERYDGNKLVYKRRSWIRFYQPQLLSFAKDFAWLMTVGWPRVVGSDFVLASNNLLGLAALILRRFGLIRRFTYLVVDYSPTRFSNPLVERVYVALDSFIARRADSVWTMSMAMLEGRERDGRVKLSELTYRLAPMGNNAHVVFAKGEVEFQMRDLVYLGNPNAKNVRADLMLEVARELMDRGEEFRLIYVGPGETAHLQRRASELELGERVVFRGSIADSLDLEVFLAGRGIGLAPYDPGLEGNFSKFADPSKIKVYLGCGLPVISTDVPPIAQELAQAGAGCIAEFSASDFADKICALWKSEDGFKATRDKARQMGAQFSWPSIFDRLMIEEGLRRET